MAYTVYHAPLPMTSYDVTVTTMTSYECISDVTEITFCQGNSIVAMVTYHIQCMPCSYQIKSEMLPDIHTVEKCFFLKPIIHSEIF